MKRHPIYIMKFDSVKKHLYYWIPLVHMGISISTLKVFPLMRSSASSISVISKNTSAKGAVAIETSTANEVKITAT